MFPLYTCYCHAINPDTYEIKLANRARIRILQIYISVYILILDKYSIIINLSIYMRKLYKFKELLLSVVVVIIPFPVPCAN